MSLDRVLGRIAARITKHERGACDGHEPTAEAHRVFLRQHQEDFAAVQVAIEARAEIDRLRALPVIATCGPCRNLISDPARVGLYCAHEGRRLDSTAEGRPVAPPTWCPWRGGGR